MHMRSYLQFDYGKIWMYREPFSSTFAAVFATVFIFVYFLYLYLYLYLRNLTQVWSCLQFDYASIWLYIQGRANKKRLSLQRNAPTFRQNYKKCKKGRKILQTLLWQFGLRRLLLFYQQQPITIFIAADVLVDKMTKYI